MNNISRYSEFVTERKGHKLTVTDVQELHDFLMYVLDNMEEQPNLLRAAYARIQKILTEIRKGNCPKNVLPTAFQTIYYFIQGDESSVDSLRERSEVFLSIDKDNYNILLNIIDDYNNLVNKHKSKLQGEFVFNIKSWAFEIEGIEEITESYEDYCDFGSNYISIYLENNPDIDEDEFAEYVTQHNKADRDMGELQDISKEEIERLGKEYKKNDNN